MDTETEMVEELQNLVEDASANGETADGGVVYRSMTFSEAGLLTSNEGLVLRGSDGSEWQITVRRVK